MRAPLLRAQRDGRGASAERARKKQKTAEE